jgi:vacuolar protein sorting-associated protein 11
VRIARILAGEGTSQFSSGSASNQATQERTVPLSVALDYVGAVLDESRKEITRLKSEVEEYNQICNRMEAEVDSLLRASQPVQSKAGDPTSTINVEDMYTKVRMALDDDEKTESVAELSREAFWREMDQTDDSFQTIARYFAKGVIQ